jgi:hypothetical protein
MPRVRVIPANSYFTATRECGGGWGTYTNSCLHKLIEELLAFTHPSTVRLKIAKSSSLSSYTGFCSTTVGHYDFNEMRFIPIDTRIGSDQ